MKNCFLSLFALAALGLSARAATFVVPGTSDPWLAGTSPGTFASAGPDAPTDVNPTNSPILYGTVAPGETLLWSAAGLVNNGPGGGGYDPNGGPVYNHYDGLEHGISDVSAPINSLMGVWYDSTTSTGTPFFMGASGSMTVPAGADTLYLGTMDGYGWWNNSGEFVAEVTTSTPEGGSFLPLYLAAAGAVTVRTLRKRRATA